MQPTHLALALLLPLALLPLAGALPALKVPEPSGNEIEDAKAAAIGVVADAEAQAGEAAALANATLEPTANATRHATTSATIDAASAPAAPALPSLADALAEPLVFPRAPPWLEEIAEEEMQAAYAHVAATIGGEDPDALLYAEKRLARLEMRLAALTGG